MAKSTQGAADPKFITYLLDPDQKYEFYYTVGNSKRDNSIEKIGVVKKMLSAHSPVFRRELHESKLRDEKAAAITDIFPATFKNLLRFVYGHDNSASLNFNDADDLLYVADKYMVDDLKSSLCSRLMKLLSSKNVCALMNNPAVYRQLELNSEITRLIQYETGKVLSSPEFPGLCSDAFLRILEQEQLSVPEIELWRAAVSWAKGRVGLEIEDGPKVRKELEKHMKHIRVCTIPYEDFCREVTSADILTDTEVAQVCQYHSNKDVRPVLTDVCDVTDLRPKPICIVRSELFHADVSPSFEPGWIVHNTNNVITTLQSDIELSSISLYHDIRLPSSSDFTLVINKLGSNDLPITVTSHQQASHEEFTVPISSDDGVILLANTQYNISITSSQPTTVYYSYWGSYSGTHFTLKYSLHQDDYAAPHQRFYITSIKNIQYKTVTFN